MKALVLAAGRGRRMEAIGQDRPKCLIRLDGRTLLERQVGALRRAGISRIGVVRGFRADLLNYPELDYFDNPRWAETNMVTSLTTATAWLRAEPVVVSYADIFYGAEPIASLMTSCGELVITFDPEGPLLWNLRFSDPLTDAETFRLSSNGAVQTIGGRAGSIEQIEGQYMGLLKFTPSSWNAVERALGRLPPSTLDKLDMTGLLRLLIEQHGVRVDAIPTRSPWGEIDTPDDLQLYEHMLKSGELTLEDAVSI